MFTTRTGAADAAQIEATLQYSAASWQEREKVWLEAFRALTYSSAITVSVFTLIAGLAMFNTLAMIVMEKTKEIAILRSMGYTRRDISRIFLWQAAIVLMLGTVAGWALGAVVTMPSRTFHPHPGYFVGGYIYRQLVDLALRGRHAHLGSHGHGGEPDSGPPCARLEPGDVIRGTAQ